MNTAEWIKEHREQNALSQQQLADALHCSTASVRVWECGEREPSSAMMMRLLPLLDMPDQLEIMNLLVSKHSIPGTDKHLLGIEHAIDPEVYAREQWNNRHPDRPVYR